jgi:hypothetical protein
MACEEAGEAAPDSRSRCIRADFVSAFGAAISGQPTLSRTSIFVEMVVDRSRCDRR